MPDVMLLNEVEKYIQKVITLGNYMNVNHIVTNGVQSITLTNICHLMLRKPSLF